MPASSCAGDLQWRRRVVSGQGLRAGCPRCHWRSPSSRSGYHRPSSVRWQAPSNPATRRRQPGAETSSRRNWPPSRDSSAVCRTWARSYRLVVSSGHRLPLPASSTEASCPNCVRGSGDRSRARGRDTPVRGMNALPLNARGRQELRGTEISNGTLQVWPPRDTYADDRSAFRSELARGTYALARSLSLLHRDTYASTPPTPRRSASASATVRRTTSAAGRISWTSPDDSPAQLSMFSGRLLLALVQPNCAV